STTAPCPGSTARTRTRTVAGPPRRSSCRACASAPRSTSAADPAPAGPSARPYRPRGSETATRTPCPAPSPTRRRHPPGARLIRPRSPPATASAPVCGDPACGRRSRAHRIVTETQDQVILLTFVLVRVEQRLLTLFRLTL